MTDKEKIREEVERVKAVHSSISLKDNKPDILVVQVCINLLSFIDSLQEDSVSEDLEKAAKDYSWAINKQVEIIKKETTDAEITEIDIKNAYIAGAEWQKEQMIKDAIDGICISNGAEYGSTIESPAGMLFLQHSTFNAGDKVKIKIIKED